MNLVRFLPVVPLLAASLGASSLAFADVPPTCSQFDNDVTCAASNVGQPCTGGGTCYQVSCTSQVAGQGTSQNLYKCETCPTLLDAGATGCNTIGGGAAFGKSCANDAGTCGKAPAYCPVPSGTYISCIENTDAGAKQPLEDASTDSPSETSSGGFSSGGSSGGSSSGGASASSSSGGTSGSSSGGTNAGESTGHGGGSSGGGCSMTPDANRGCFSACLGLVGIAALGLGRLRRRR